MAKTIEKLAVVILDWNQSQLTIECLDSLQSSVPPGDKQVFLIVVDNNSEPEEKTILTDYLKGAQRGLPDNFSLELIENDKNYGFAKGNNIGIKQADRLGCEAIFILNNDAEVAPDCLKNLISELEKEAVVAPKIYYASGYEYHEQRYQPDERGRVIWYAGGEIDWDNIMGHHVGVDEVDTGQFDKKKTTDFATGCAFAARREVFKEVGLFDERFFLYLEDLDFSYRIRQAGYRIKFSPTVKVYHKNAASSGSGSVIHDYYFTRNRLLFAQKHAPWKTKLALWRQAVGYLFGGDKVKRQAVWDFIQQSFGYKKVDNI